MSPRLSLPLLCLALHPLAAEPEAKPLEHYEALLQQSPFAVASAAPPPAPAATETASFARGYYVVGMAQLGETPFVTISTRDRQKRFSLSVGETSAEGITLEGVEWAPEIGKSRVTLKKGGELGVVSFDEAAMKVAAVPTPSPTPENASHGWRGPGNRRMVMPGQQNGRAFQWSQNQQDREERRRQWRRRREAIPNQPQQ
ncbi:MAG TPA: hypothetical protein VNQ90_07125 [Chthoniobacteraceae bacterium]|nr:hypothetical protein [Chthoniobacteraceae bacterium]